MICLRADGTPCGHTVCPEHREDKKDSKFVQNICPQCTDAYSCVPLEDFDLPEKLECSVCQSEDTLYANVLRSEDEDVVVCGHLLCGRCRSVFLRGFFRCMGCEKIVLGKECPACKPTCPECGTEGGEEKACPECPPHGRNKDRRHVMRRPETKKIRSRCPVIIDGKKCGAFVGEWTRATKAQATCATPGCSAVLPADRHELRVRCDVPDCTTACCNECAEKSNKPVVCKTLHTTQGTCVLCDAGSGRRSRSSARNIEQKEVVTCCLGVHYCLDHMREKGDVVVESTPNAYRCKRTIFKCFPCIKASRNLKRKELMEEVAEEEQQIMDESDDETDDSEEESGVGSQSLEDMSDTGVSDDEEEDPDFEA